MSASLVRAFLLRYLYAYAMVVQLAIVFSGLFFGYVCQHIFSYTGLIIGPLYYLPLTYIVVVPVTMLIAVAGLSSVSDRCWSTKLSLLRLAFLPVGIYVIFSTLLLLFSLAHPQTDCF